MIKRILIILCIFCFFTAPAQAFPGEDELEELKDISATLKGLREDINAMNLGERIDDGADSINGINTNLESLTATLSDGLEATNKLSMIMDNIELIFLIVVILVILIVALIICPLIYMARKIGKIAKRR